MRLVVIFETYSLEEEKSIDLTIGISGVWGSNFGQVVGSFILIIDYFNQIFV